MLIVMGHIHVDPADVVHFMEEIRVLAVLARQRVGNISFDVAADDAEAGRLLVTERWVDQPALTAHLEAVATNAFVERWSGRMRGKIAKYDASNERGLMDF